MSAPGVKSGPRSKASGIPFNARFTDVAAQAGLKAPIIYGGVDHKDYIIEVVGCGIAFFDFDNDGWLDILVLSGTRLDGTPPGATNRLYKNNRNGTFTDVSIKAGLERTGWAGSVTIGDYDNDGFEDIFITYWGRARFITAMGRDLHGRDGRPGCAAGTPWNSGATWIDYDRDGNLDLFVATYLDFDPNRSRRVQAHSVATWMCRKLRPRGLRQHHKLYRNNGNAPSPMSANNRGSPKLAAALA
jgi:hypothetical protein